MLISSLDFPSSLFLELAFVIFLLILCNLGKQASFILLSLLINKTLNNRLCAALAACFIVSCTSLAVCFLFDWICCCSGCQLLSTQKTPAQIDGCFIGTEQARQTLPGRTLLLQTRKYLALREPPVYLGLSSPSGVC